MSTANTVLPLREDEGTQTGRTSVDGGHLWRETRDLELEGGWGDSTLNPL